MLVKTECHFIMKIYEFHAFHHHQTTDLLVRITLLIVLLSESCDVCECRIFQYLPFLKQNLPTRRQNVHGMFKIDRCFLQEMDNQILEKQGKRTFSTVFNGKSKLTTRTEILPHIVKGPS